MSIAATTLLTDEDTAEIVAAATVELSWPVVTKLLTTVVTALVVTVLKSAEGPAAVKALFTALAAALRATSFTPPDPAANLATD